MQATAMSKLKFLHMTTTAKHEEITLTELETEVLKTIQYSDYFEAEDPTGLIWTLDCNDFADGLFKSKKALGGVMASLSNKGLIICYPDGKNSVCGYTIPGLKLLIRLGLANDHNMVPFTEYINDRQGL
ncbi:hypothetical protein MA9V1_036 [Chryseobacterium phage MA9V-1]|nr:hypothetical protein MA9V1_036 [Chryseobacterium phage MA9V-1]